MEPTGEEQLEALVSGGRLAASSGLLRCSSGNISIRLSEDTMAISSRGTWLADLSTVRIAVCRIGDGTPLNDVAPSVEAGLHRGIYSVRPDVRSVLHFQSPAATALACLDGPPPDYAVIPEVPFYIGTVTHVAYLPPGSAALASAVTRAMTHHGLAQLENHGQVVVGRHPQEVVEKGCFFELACEIILARSDLVRPLPAPDVDQLMQDGGTV